MNKIAALLLLSAALSACSGNERSPEGVAQRFMQAQVQGNTAEMIRLATEADQAAAALAPNTSDTTLYPEEDDKALHELLAKHIKVNQPTAQVSGDTASVEVPFESPDVDFSGLMLSALFGGVQDEEQAAALIAKQMDEAPRKTETETFALVKAGGEWRVDTAWAERAEAKKREDAERAKAEELKKIADDYEEGVRQNFPQANAALKQLVKLHPNDKGWAEEFAAMQTLLPRLRKFTVNVRDAGIYQGEFQVVVGVKNGSSMPLKNFTVKYTFLNGSEPVGEPQYETFTSSSWFSTRVLDPGGNTEATATGTPPEGWTGQKVKAEVTAYAIDAD